MENLQLFWHSYGMEILLTGLLLVLMLLARVVFLLTRQARQLILTDVAGRAMSKHQQQQLNAVEKEVINAIIKGQLVTKDGIHRSGTELREKMAATHSNLLQQLMTDAMGLKEGLTGRFGGLQTDVTKALSAGQLTQQKNLETLRSTMDQSLSQQRESFEKRQVETLKSQQEALNSGMGLISKQLRDALTDSSDGLNKRVEKLTDATDLRLKEISTQVDKRLAQGFEKTTETFTKVLEHLSRIDEAQKKITELSSNVVSLQEVLTDKRSRGAFGEVQLNGLIRNLLPEDQFSLQHVLSNGTRVDCFLYLPEPTGNIPIDAKFPLESYQRMMDRDASKPERDQAARQFRQDIKKHIKDIASKYLIPGETSDGAIMFLPAEAVFAEIHAHFPELVEEAQRARVWIVSPTTLMAILTTARAVIKDVETRKQVHVIQEHLRYLSADFGRFQTRMDALSKHIRMANDDVQQVNTSAKKITSRFDKIEKVELDDELLEDEPILLAEKDDTETSK